MANVPPVLLSAIICDRVIFDKITSMPSLINIIQNINAPQYPIRNSIVFFCELTNGHGITPTTVKLVNAKDEDKALFEQNGNVEFKDVRQIVTLAVNIQGVLFPEPGEYRFQLLSQGQLIGERKIVCRKVDMKKPPQNQ